MISWNLNYGMISRPNISQYTSKGIQEHRRTQKVYRRIEQITEVGYSSGRLEWWNNNN